MRAEIEALVTPYVPADVARELEALLARALPDATAPTIPLEPEPPGPFAPDDPTEEGPTIAPEALPARYADLGRIGAGGMGEVRRVRDRELGRTCAYKAIRPDLLGRPNVVARFVEEAQIGAQLQHPNLPPVYDGGRLADGRPWFTMKEVRGRTFGEVIREAHRGEVTESALRRLGDVLASVCDAVGYAHGRGVVHRDLKPDNVMVGSHGEVFVLDWGLAKVVGRPDLALADGDLEPEVATARSGDEALRTRAGGVMGTAAYMPPEQARGEVERLDARADVYAMGAILYELLSGRPPYEGRDARAVLRQVLAGPPEPPGRAAGPRAGATFDFLGPEPTAELAGPPLPEELVSLCLACLSREPGDRPPDGAAVGAALRGWLDGAHKRARALEVVASADTVVAEAAALRAWALAARAEGAALLAPVKPWAPEEEKAPGWAKQDEAERVERRAALLELRREALLRAALTHAPGLAEANAALAALERERHAAAESVRDEAGAARAEVGLREHADALPEAHPVRASVAAYLRGDGALTLVTDPPGAEVWLHRYEPRNRRLVEVPVGRLGRTPLRGVPLPMGSYLCVLRYPEAEGRPVRYPVSIGRGEHWDGVPPGGREPQPVRLPRPGELGPDDCLVPAGWFRAGGDPVPIEALPARRLWCDAFVVRRFPVTNAEYVAFLNARAGAGEEAEALRVQPRERTLGGPGVPVYRRDAAGRFQLGPDADGHPWEPDVPVVLVPWAGAVAYADWMARETGRPWRLLGELEWEKAARGVDGRFYPWGDFLDPSWACIRASHEGHPLPHPVHAFPVDCSVYGVRGLAGNVEDWTADAFDREGPELDGERVVVGSRGSDLGAARGRRGGVWGGSDRGARCASRSVGMVNPGLGFRIAYRP